MRPCACQPVLVPRSFFLLPDFTSGLLWLTELALLPLQPSAGLPAGWRTLASRPTSHYRMCRHPQGLHPAHGCYLWGEPPVNMINRPLSTSAPAAPASVRYGFNPSLPSDVQRRG